MFGSFQPPSQEQDSNQFNQEEPVQTNDMDSSQHILSQGPIKTD